MNKKCCELKYAIVAWQICENVLFFIRFIYYYYLKLYLFLKNNKNNNNVSVGFVMKWWRISRKLFKQLNSAKDLKLKLVFWNDDYRA